MYYKSGYINCRITGKRKYAAELKLKFVLRFCGLYYCTIALTIIALFTFLIIYHHYFSVFK